MKGMYRFAFLALFGLTLFAQTPAPSTQKPPADVDLKSSSRV